MRDAYRMQDVGGGGSEITTWVGYAAQLLGAGGLGFLLRELLKRGFQHAERRDDVAAGLRAEMVRRIESLEKNYTALEGRERETFRKAVKLEAENIQLRRRYHDLVNWIATQPGLPTPPKWLYERVEGPTERDAAPKPRKEPEP